MSVSRHNGHLCYECAVDAGLRKQVHSYNWYAGDKAKEYPLPDGVAGDRHYTGNDKCSVCTKGNMDGIPIIEIDCLEVDNSA